LGVGAGVATGVGECLGVAVAVVFGAGKGPAAAVCAGVGDGDGLGIGVSAGVGVRAGRRVAIAAVAAIVGRTVATRRATSAGVSSATISVTVGVEAAAPDPGKLQAVAPVSTTVAASSSQRICADRRAAITRLESCTNANRPLLLRETNARLGFSNRNLHGSDHEVLLVAQLFSLLRERTSNFRRATSTIGGMYLSYGRSQDLRRRIQTPKVVRTKCRI